MGKTIMLINTFPIVQAQGGGQKREEAMVKAYEKVFDRVQYVSVFYKGYYKHYTSYDIPLSSAQTDAVNKSPHTVDMICGHAIYEDPEVKRKMTEILQRLQPDVIQVEQGFPYLGLKPLLAELGMKPKLILSSHNVEAPMKREILEGLGMKKAQVNKIVGEIEQVELEITKDAEMVIACTDADAAFYKKNGAKKVVTARNGMAKIESNEAARNKWQDFFGLHHIVHKALFVGSAHPPNWTGFTDMVGDKLGFMPFNGRVILAGGVCDYFDRTFREPYNPGHTTFWQRVELAGRPSDDSLGALLQLTDVIILPITEGGGSNLKTAEAILADKPIVATSHAFRSFEHLQDLPNIYIADTQKDFHTAILAAFKNEPRKRTAAQQKAAESVLWENCLRAAIEEVAKV